MEAAAVIVLLTIRMYPSMQNKLHDFFTSTFQASYVEVEDLSHLHAKHAGARETGGGHYKVLIISENFKGMSRIDRHRKITKSAMATFPGMIHALAVQAFTQEEFKSLGLK